MAIRKTNRGYNSQTNASTTVHNGIKLRSGTEKIMYQLLEKEGIPFAYEAQKFPIIEGFKYGGESFEKQLNGKGEFKDRGKKTFKDSIYTPDFTNPTNEELKFVIEVKGRSMPDYPRTWRLFKKHLLLNHGEVILFVPRNRADCIEVVNILKERGYGQK